MEILKVLNNNAVISKEDKIVLGKGVGFQKKIGDRIDTANVEKMYHFATSENMEQIQELLQEMPMEMYAITEDIFQYAKEKLHKRYTSMIRFSIMDHLHGAIERSKEGIQLNNVLLWEIKRLFKKEYEVGLKAIAIVEGALGVHLSEDEAGFVALYLINSEKDEDVDTQKLTVLIREISNIVKYSMNTVIDEESVFYDRFITHIRFLAFRILRQKKLLDQEAEEEIYELLLKRNSKVGVIVDKINHFLDQKYDYLLSMDDKVYLMIHIHRILEKCD